MHVLEQMGLPVSDAIRLLMVRIARQKARLFNVKVSNEDTMVAMEKARGGTLKSFNPSLTLLADLNADDTSNECLQARLSPSENQLRYSTLDQALVRVL